MDKVQKAILKTLAFFAIFKRPLTLEEIWHYLYKEQASKLQVLMALKKLEKSGKILQENYYYTLGDNKDVFSKFRANREICLKRWQKVRKTTKFLQKLPFVKNISVINSLSYGSSNEKSDIDIFIVASRNRLWTARALVIFLLELMGQNKNRWYQADKFCLGFAFDEEKMALGHLRLDSPSGNDISFTYWLANLTPVYDRKIYKDFVSSENSWIFKDLPNWTLKNVQTSDEKRSYFEKILNGKFGDKLEKILATIQIKRIWSEQENFRQGSSVIADIHMLKLHPYDKREEHRKRWQELTRNIFFG